jgi:cation diffusion facilitator CzcD-associated flavoprotein CzcO
VRRLDVVVIGGGQAALAVGYYLRRTGLAHALLDEQEGPGGAWRHAWPSLRLFSPSQWSSLPGWLMPRGADEYPTRDETIAYLAEYERRYGIPVERPVHVAAVRRGDPLGAGAASPAPLIVETADEHIEAAAVVSATGSWAAPVIPAIDGMDTFGGVVRHSAHYAGPEAYAGQRVVVVGGGNSGAQIVAELSRVARVTWATLTPPHFLPDEVDGRYLFEQATVRYQALREGRTPPPPRSLGDVVAVASVREARARGALDAVPMFTRFTARGVVWPDGREEPIDAVVLATGFRPALAHLAPLGVLDATGRIVTDGTRAVAEPRLWLVGYGEWTGFASATLIGVGRSARATVEQVVGQLRQD